MVRRADWTTISSVLQDFLGSPGAVLFAGAGVGVQAGLPTWPAYIEGLARSAEKYEPAITTLIRERAKSRQFAEAAQLFKMCQMPEDEKYKVLSAPFQAPDFRRLRPLLSLPFAAFVTTNYDRSLLDCWSDVRHTAPYCAELGETTLRQAIYWRDPFIARIHGRTEVPTSMVVGTEDYAKLKDNEDYLEFVHHLLTRRRCLFVGFSFLDPAISSILDTVRRYVGSGQQPLHVAIIPHQTELHAALNTANIDVVQFESGTHDEFEALWGGISDAARSMAAPRRMRSASPGGFPMPLEEARKVLASCYVNAKMKRQLVPLRDLIVQGFILALTSNDHDGLSQENLITELRHFLPLDADELGRIVDEQVQRLKDDGLCEESSGRLVGRKLDNQLEQDVDTLIKGAADRYFLRQGGKAPSPEQVSLMRTLIEEALLERGWDLGAEFAGANRGQLVAAALVDRIIAERAPHMDRSTQVSIRDAVTALFHQPNDQEAAILSQLGRFAFGIDIVLQQGRTALLHSSTLPQKLYLDASVALPAIANGHPLRSAYVDTLARWRAAGAGAGFEPQVMISDVFVEEILGHRNKAIELVKAEDLEDPRKLNKHIAFRGAENTNVFVGAYASWVGRESKRLPFATWLAEHAPFTNEVELQAFLATQGINSIDLVVPAELRERHRLIRSSLGEAYERERPYDPKPPVLIDHEARQLTVLHAELEAGRRVLFVTADRTLRRCAAGPILGFAGSAIVSHLALIELIDLLVGIQLEPRSFARLLWGVHFLDAENALRSYFVDLALRQRDEAMVMSLPMIIEEIVHTASVEATSMNLDLLSAHPNDEARTAKLLDRYEDVFMDAMREAVQKRQSRS